MTSTPLSHRSAPRGEKRFECLADLWHVETGLLTSVTEVGFSVGGSGALIVGDPYATNVTLGFETIQNFGSRFYSRVAIKAHERIVLAPIIEVTNMPSADAYGVRLLGEVQWQVGGGFALAARGGYQARQATSGGAGMGGSLSYAF